MRSELRMRTVPPLRAFLRIPCPARRAADLCGKSLEFLRAGNGDFKN